MRKRILISNDDGVNGKGISFLVKSLSILADVFIVVPHQERSATSRAISLHKPLRVIKIKKNEWVVNGTPVDCVRIGAIEILKGNVDLIVLGINNGPNLGEDIGYSGTVAGAIESVMLGHPSFAISLVNKGKNNFLTAAIFARQISKKLLKKKLLLPLNVNVPDLALKQIKGVSITAQGKWGYRKKVIKGTDPRGRSYFWIASRKIKPMLTKHSDVYAISKNKISITPLSLDFTDYKSIEILKEWRLGV